MTGCLKQTEPLLYKSCLAASQELRMVFSVAIQGEEKSGLKRERVCLSLQHPSTTKCDQSQRSRQCWLSFSRLSLQFVLIWNIQPWLLLSITHNIFQEGKIMDRGGHRKAATQNCYCNLWICYCRYSFFFAKGNSSPLSRRLTFAFSLGSLTMPLVELLSSLDTTQRNSAWSSFP